MCSKLAFLVLLNVVLATAEIPCDCSDERLTQAIKETNDIVDFLNVLASKDLPDEDRNPVVHPAVISGSLGCDCSAGQLRKKRTIFPEENIPIQEQKVQDKIGKARFSTRNCAKGYARIGSICMPQHLLQ